MLTTGQLDEKFCKHNCTNTIALHPTPPAAAPQAEPRETLPRSRENWTKSCLCISFLYYSPSFSLHPPTLPMPEYQVSSYTPEWLLTGLRGSNQGQNILLSRFVGSVAFADPLTGNIYHINMNHEPQKPTREWFRVLSPSPSKW